MAKSKDIVKSKVTPSIAGEELYPSVSVVVAQNVEGSKPITVQKAKELLGVEETEGADFLIKLGEKKYKCKNNMKNRPLYQNNCLDLVQSILKKQWHFNGEPIIVGKKGSLLNGQHSLVALLMAEHERKDGPNSEHWKGIWPEECYIEKLIVYGISEDSHVVDTMDTCKPRSVADIIFRSDYFADIQKPSERKAVARIADFTIRTLRNRTGADRDAFSPRKTNVEAVDFAERHKTLFKAVSFVFTEDQAKGEEDEAKKISRYVSLGTAASLLYLMAQASSNDEQIEEYNTTPNESKLDFGNWDKAEEYWLLIAKKDPSVLAVTKAIANLADIDTGVAGRSSKKEIIALLIKGWEAWFKNEVITADDLQLEFGTTEEGIRFLDEYPVVGGIDQDLSEDIEDDEVTVPNTEIVEQTEEEEFQEPDGEEVEEEEPAKPAGRKVGKK